MSCDAAFKEWINRHFVFSAVFTEILVRLPVANELFSELAGQLVLLESMECPLAASLS